MNAAVESGTLIVPGRAQPPEPAGNSTAVPEVPEDAHRGPCRDCGRNMVIQAAYTRDPTLRDRYVCHGGHGMCRGCHSVARYHGSRDPVVRRQRHRDPDRCSSDTCIDCHSLVTTPRRLQSDPGRYAGYRRYGGYGRCQPCYGKAKRRGTLTQPPVRLDEATLARLRTDVGLAPGRDPVGEVVPRHANR